MARNARIVSVAVGLLFCTFMSAFHQPRAYALSGLTISPPLKEITIGPGLLEATSYLTLQNNTTESITAHLQLVDLRALGEYGGNSLDKANLPDKYNLADWMKLPGGDTVVISKGETVKVEVKITNRADLSPGGHYGAIIVTPAGGSSVNSNINISQQLISLLFVKKVGGEVFGLELEPLQLKNHSDVPQEVTTRFKSTGNVHVVPRGYIEVTDPAGRVVAKGILNQDSSIILPGSTRQFVTLMQPVEPATRSGKYKITVYYRYDGQDSFKSQSVYFTKRIPVVRLVAAAAAFAILVGAIVYWSVRRRKYSSR